MLLTLMLVSNLSYSQYPILKKLGSDSVVIMTLKQANQVNSYYVDRETKISQLKDSVAKQKSFAELQSAYAEYMQNENKKNSFKSNEELIKYYEEREELWKYRVHRQAKTNMFIFLGMIFLFLFKT